MVNGGAPLVGALAGTRWTSGGRPVARVRKSQVCNDQRCNAATGLARLPAAQAVLGVAFATVSGHPV
jgi:hypothetical protein